MRSKLRLLFWVLGVNALRRFIGLLGLGLQWGQSWEFFCPSSSVWALRFAYGSFQYGLFYVLLMFLLGWEYWVRYSGLWNGHGNGNGVGEGDIGGCGIGMGMVCMRRCLDIWCYMEDTMVMPAV